MSTPRARARRRRRRRMPGAASPETFPLQLADRLVLAALAAVAGLRVVDLVTDLDGLVERRGRRFGEPVERERRLLEPLEPAPEEVRPLVPALVAVLGRVHVLLDGDDRVLDVGGGIDDLLALVPGLFPELDLVAELAGLLGGEVGDLAGVRLGPLPGLTGVLRCARLEALPRPVEAARIAEGDRVVVRVRVEVHGRCVEEER